MDTIISIILTTVIAIAITWYFTRKQMKKNEITHFSINSYDVGKGLHNEFPKFQLTYDNKELSNDVLVLKGGFINSGRNDITGLKNASDINIILPNECSLREIKIKQLSNELGITVCKKEATNIISFGIDEKFMSGESFEYTAIVETTKEIKNLHRKIEFKHRIPNTSKIKNEYFRGEQTQMGHLIMQEPTEKALGFMSLMAVVFFCVASMSFIFVQKMSYCLMEKGSHKEMSIYVTPGPQLYVSDNSIIPFIDNKTITKEELNSKYDFSPKTDFSWSSSDSITGIMLALFALIYFVGTIFSFYLWNKKKRIYQLLERYEQE